MRPVCLHCIPSTFSKNACCGEGESHAFLYRVEGLDPLPFRTQRKGGSKHGQHCDCFHADIIAQKRRQEPSPLYLVFDSEAANDDFSASLVSSTLSTCHQEEHSSNAQYSHRHATSRETPLSQNFSLAIPQQKPIFAHGAGVRLHPLKGEGVESVRTTINP